LIGPFGYSVEFTHTLGSSITYPFMTDTWPTGTFPIPGYGLGAIPVGLIPEPSTLALAGLGAVVIGLWGRERKRER
jgi:hypothetical protein